MVETELETAERHVREAEVRLGRLQDLAIQLDPRRHSAVLLMELIATMGDSLKLAQSHVDRLTGKSVRGKSLAPPNAV